MFSSFYTPLISSGTIDGKKSFFEISELKRVEVDLVSYKELGNPV